MLWNWAYRFEAYVPAARRTMGHYALPVLWGEQMVGWANLRKERGRLTHQLGFATTRPRDVASAGLTSGENFDGALSKPAINAASAILNSRADLSK